MSIKTSSDSYTFVITFEEDGDLPDDGAIEKMVGFCLNHWFNVLSDGSLPRVIGVAYMGRECDDSEVS